MFFYFLIGMNVAYADNSYSQTTKLNISLKNKAIKEVFSEIEKNSEYIFLYNDENLDATKKVSVNIHSQTIDKILDEVFRNTDNTYYISDRQVFISKHKNSAITEKKVKEPAEQSPMQQITVTGTVTDTDGEPLIGVAVKLKSQSSVGVATNNDGAFSINVKNMNETLVFTYVGMKPKELKLKAGTTNYKVAMESNETELGAVVVNAGIVQYNKMGFTGSYKTVTQEELRSVGNINVLQSLKSLDPAFVITDNNLQGSNPNQLANISIRGGSTVNISSVFDDMSSNPNEPLFILDGFEATLQVINDLDINRIESITILKDAGSTAIYGSKGGNGVVVIETIKPKPGQVRIGYRGDMQLAVADLSVYNLMNAKEKLEFELKAGRYGDINDWYNTSPIEDYYARLENIERGIDTYWLKVPIQTAITQSHSLDVSGGGEAGFLYQVGTNFKNIEGVMKGSNRESFGGNVNLNYRMDKLSISNNLSTSVTNGYEGGWGSFYDFAGANPYYRMINDDGTIPAFLDSYKRGENYATYTAPNPYYNAMLTSKRDTKNYSLTNNTSISWFIRPNLRWTASLSLNTSTSDIVSFKDPRHTDFHGLDYTQQGRYTSANGSSWSYSANTNLNYRLNLKTVHNLTFAGRAAVRSMSSNSDSYIVTGFPKGVAGIPSYSYSYLEGSRPGYSENIFREANFLLAFNYNYQYRYLFDFTYNADGSTAFGRNKKFKNFWSVGTGWNISSEPFAKDWKWMQHMKIRGSYGKNGNQNVNNLSTNVYSYYPGNDIFGAASYLSDLANPNLDWQVVTKLSAGIDLTLLDNRFNLTLDTYITDTDPMVLYIDQKPSSGISRYLVSLGYLTTKGYELSTNYQFIRNQAKRVSLSARLTAGFNRSEYDGFDKALNNLNESFKKESTEASQNINSLVQYRDGGSPGDMWAVRSLGIDPATGREIFLKKDGTPTFDYSADDRVVIANRSPKVQGIFGFSFRYKELTANFNFRYSLGGYDLNSALFSKVENISGNNIIYNQDKRALYDRWQNPGDISEFKGISLTTKTPISSRFIQRNNYFSGESARLAWDFTKSPWIKSLGLRDLQLSVSYSDLFRISTIRQERGVDYPYQRAVTMGLSAQF
ncbi:SusC/RagA family TonB-linked outer membrane protein [Bacteroidia bacterium]|nr:SusC/RagA family TonB-linked outer membrane protein [Bacteroidia bacterium]